MQMQSLDEVGAVDSRKKDAVNEPRSRAVDTSKRMTGRRIGEPRASMIWYSHTGSRVDGRGGEPALSSSQGSSLP